MSRPLHDRPAGAAGGRLHQHRATWTDRGNVVDEITSSQSLKDYTGGVGQRDVTRYRKRLSGADHSRLGIRANRGSLLDRGPCHSITRLDALDAIADGLDDARA